ncbi:hypothetical protein [Desulfovibrio sp. Huiquan2017]|uniref:hypothetical protein n=1 Tax=Desulfovibrio sp. Huiquan2017 TaxID=2816861 RepID=UPI001A931BB0|nr:hypothetical protein [Desulfovibrio sp. Huiquan2017]
MDFNTLMGLRRYLSIQHHVPGRIRIKFSLKLLADPRAQALKEEKEGRTQPSWIRQTKVNMFTRNVIIEYDPQVVQPEKLHEALITKDEARFSELAAEFKAILES